ncbi:MAG: (4Fe-4S)-binding protein [Streptococcaceae bacterium]|nr:(4Fe-4S)-binding protein [Streptococcaceae bacterium]
MDNGKIDGKPVTEEQLLALGYKKYYGKDMDIYYSKDVCRHVGNCVRGNPKVFEVGRRPWVIADNGEVDENIRVINTCPAGALKYIRPVLKLGYD